LLLYILHEKYINILALEMASPGNQHTFVAYMDAQEQKHESRRTKLPIEPRLDRVVHGSILCGPTNQLTDLTQPNALQVEKFGPNPTQSNTTNKFNQPTKN